MPRHDLLALTLADLEALTNRGTVKRAGREVEAAGEAVTVSETAEGEVAVQWPDGVECRLPAAATLQDGRCTCAAATLCRHLVQSVLAYQRQASDRPAAGSTPDPWDPGQITDAELEPLFSRPRLAAARRRLDQGLLVDLVRGVKPLARFEDDQCCLRFLVPGDGRYVHCDCADAAPCGHVPLAVWAFRALPPDKEAGLVRLGWKDQGVPMGLLAEIEAALVEACGWGLSGLPTAWRDRLVCLEERCRAGELVWPADILGELLLQFDAYHAHDARFSQEAVVQLFGELLIRLDAIRQPSAAGQEETGLPQVWVRGGRSDRLIELATARFVGLGCGVRTERRRVRMVACMQDSDSGSVVALEKEVPDPPADSSDVAKSFAQLGAAPSFGGASLAQLGSGQLLTRGAKRSPAHRLVLPRGRAHVMPQAFAWEQLRAPLLAEDFREVRARLSGGAPASLRPRRLTEGLFVAPIAAVETARFNTARQQIEARLRDPSGHSALLRHPFTNRGRLGAEALLSLLTTRADVVRFVAGHATLGPEGLEVRPTCVVHQSGPDRRGLQPWIGTDDDAAPATDAPRETPSAADPVRSFQIHLSDALARVLIVGLQRADDAVRRLWHDLARRAEGLGLVRFKDRLASLAGTLDRKSAQLRWDWQAGADPLLTLLALARLGQDLSTA
jgi:hypothetical protein